LGILGIDRFYKGEAGWGVLKLISVGGFGVRYVVDLCTYAYRFGTTGQWTKAAA
jgi:TM2 domain-containing membrane protein YozV